METRLKAIVLKKYPIKERDLVVQFLSDSGDLFSAIAFGGQGGGPHHKSSPFQYGHALGLLVRSKFTGADQELIQIKEKWEVWSPENIAKSYRAFQLMSYMLEIVHKVARPKSWEQLDSTEHQGLYRLLSNALFYLDLSVKSQQFNFDLHHSLFLAKLSFELGVAPEFRNCGFCRIDLRVGQLAEFSVQDGFFVCTQCREVPASREVQGLWHLLARTWELKYPEAEQLIPFLNVSSNEILASHLAHHLGIQLNLAALE